MALNRLAFLLATGVALLALTPSAQAQTPSGIRGVIMDKDTQPLPGATVTVSNPALGVTAQGAVTDAKGEFRIAPLPPGRGYKLTVSFQTMSTLVINDIEVTSGRLALQQIILRPAAEMKTTIRVTAKTDVVDTSSASTQTVISAEFIDALPILGRNYQDVLTLAPGVSDVNGTGNPNIHGARDTDTITLVDGVSTTDPVTGQRGQELNIESIQEIEIKTSGASAEFSRGQGGFVNIITKSGGNEFEGAFKFFWRGNTLDKDGAGLDDPTLHGGLGETGLRDLQFNDYLPFLSLAGPIKKDKAWYFFTAEYIQEQTPVNALTQAYVQTTTESRVFGKLSWDVSTNHKLVFTATIDPQEFDNQGLNSFRTIESGYTDKLGGTNLVLKETSIFNPNVFLETTVQDFTTSPERIPTLAADTNGNGVLYIDRNGNHFIDATERDTGDDFDRDGKYDVFEDSIAHDYDKDGHVTPPGSFDRTGSTGGCEGPFREDLNCDGFLNNGISRPLIIEDKNNNGICDFALGERDINNDGVCGLVNEDRNGDGILADRLFLQANEDRNGNGVCDPGEDLNGDGMCSQNELFVDENGKTGNFYPYRTLTPLPRDRDYTFDNRSVRVNGPYNQNFTGDRGRITLRQDLTVFVPDWHGSHEMKIGGKIEREHYSQDSELRPFVFDNVAPPTVAALTPTIAVILPAENQVANEATSTTVGIYVTDTFKPRQNLTIGLGLRFDREATDSFGYTPFEPAQQRNLYDRLINLGGAEVNGGDLNSDGFKSNGYCSDPIFVGKGDPCKNPGASDLLQDLTNLGRTATSRLTQHHTSTTIVASRLTSLFPVEAFFVGGSAQALACPEVRCSEGETCLNTCFLKTQGSTFQQQEPFRLTNNNLAPRLSISWDPFSDSKTKIFASWNRFYDKLFLQSVVTEEGPDQILRYYKKDQDGVTGSGIPNNQIGDALAKAPPTASQIDRGLNTPFSDEFTVGFERELAPEVSLRMSYINRKGRLGLQDTDVNHHVRIDNGKPVDELGRVDPRSGQRNRDNKPDLYINNFFFNQILRTENSNESSYHGIEAQVTKRLSRKWQMDASYTYSRAQGAAEAFDSQLGNDPATLGFEYGYLDFDQRHVVRFNAVTFLPGDWQVGGVLSWQSGLPYSLINTFLALDDFDYPANRQLFGELVQTSSGSDTFQGERRNSRRNDAYYNINLEAQKAFVLGHVNSKVFLSVENLLNTDVLRITTYEPFQQDRGGSLQINSTRAFGRRWQAGFQFEF